MKFLLSVVLSGFIFFAGRGQGIVFMHDLDSALVKAKAENKLVFVDFYTSWCGPCKMMTNDIFPQKAAGDFFNSKFINCKVQCDDNGKGVNQGKRYSVVAYPTLMFLNGDGALVHSAAGSLSVDGLIGLAQIAMDPEKNLMTDVNRWKSGDRDEQFVLQYFNRLTKAYRNEKAKEDFYDYFFKLDNKDKQSALSFQLIKIVGAAPFDSLMNYMENNVKGYYASVGKPEIDSFIARNYLFYLRNLAAYQPEEYKAALSKFKEKGYSYYNEFKMYCDVYLNKEIKGFMADGTAFLAKYGKKNDAYTVSLCSLLGNYTGKKDQSLAGINWMEDLLKRNRKPEYLPTYFYLLWRNYQFDKALKVGYEIRSNDIKRGQSTEDIDKQIEMVKGLKTKYSDKKSV